MATETMFFLMNFQPQLAQLSPTEKWITIGAQIAVICALVVTIRQTNLLRRQLELSAQNRQSELAFRFIERWNEPNFVQMRIPVVSFLRVSRDFESQMEKIENDPEFGASFTLILNFMEELGLAWNRKHLDRDLCLNFFGTMVNVYYTKFSEYIDHKRLHSDRVFAEFRRMNQEVERKITQPKQGN